MNNKFILIAGVIGIAFLLLDKNKNMIQSAIFKKYGTVRSEKFFRVLNAVKKLPLNKKQLEFIMAHIMTETGMFTSRSTVFDLNNNASGIYYSGSAAQKANGATKGTLRPASEGGNYARFQSLDNWAKEYFRVLNKGSFPLTAKNIIEYNDKLKINNYYDTRGAANYLKNITFFYNFLIKNKF